MDFSTFGKFGVINLSKNITVFRIFVFRHNVFRISSKKVKLILMKFSVMPDK